MTWLVGFTTVAVLVAVAAWTGAGRSRIAVEDPGPMAEGSDDLVAYSHYDPASDRGGVYVANASGGEARLVVAGDGVTYRDVAWSPGGEWLYYAAGPSAATSLWRIRPDGTEPEVVVDANAGAIRSLVVAPAGDHLAFVRETASRGTSLWIADLDGKGGRRLRGPAEERADPDFACSEVGPTEVIPQGFSPDGARLLVELRRHGCEASFTRVVVLDVSRDELVAGITLPAGASGPRWSPSGDRIAFESTDGMSVVDAASGERRDLGSGLYPGWSPDGTLAFTRGEPRGDGMHYELWIAPDADPTRARPVGDLGLHASSPEWSADGRRIAFLADHERGSAIWAVDVSDGRPVRLGGPDSGYIGSFDPGPGV